MALKDTVIYRVHLFQDIRRKLLLAALAANAGGNVAHHHQMFLTAIIVFDGFLDHFSSAIAAIRVTVHDRPPPGSRISPLRHRRCIDGDESEHFLSFTLHCRSSQDRMEWSTPDKTQHQAAFPSWIIRILFQQFSMLDDCRFDLY